MNSKLELEMKLKRIDLSYFNEQQLFDDINVRSYYLSFCITGWIGLEYQSNFPWSDNILYLK